jgi:hypothetical protein
VRRLGIGTFALLSALIAATAAHGQTHLVVISGLGGEPGYRELFHEMGSSLVQAARDRFAVPGEHILFFAERPERDASITGKSTKDNVESAFARIAASIEPDARLFVVLIGHGSAQGGASRFNLPGPDMTAADFAAVLARFPTQEIVFANLTSASGGFLPALSGPRRTIITATKSGTERNETLFGGHFVAALVDDGADTDKDDRVSVLEAFDYARREVIRTYERENRLRTEHAQLDDNGDGVGSQEPDPQNGDGAVAGAQFLAATRPGIAATATDDPALAALYAERLDLNRDIAALRLRKAELAPDAYERELERLLLALARANRAIRTREGGTR